jgi:hypothetical protein
MSAMLAHPPRLLCSAMPWLHTNHQAPHFPAKLAFFYNLADEIYTSSSFQDPLGPLTLLVSIHTVRFVYNILYIHDLIEWKIKPILTF